MKNALLFVILSLIVSFILIVALLFHLVYFNNLHKSTKPITEAEKQQVIEILNKSMNLDDYQIKFGNVLVLKKSELVQIKLIKDNSKNDYIIDLISGKIIRK